MPRKPRKPTRKMPKKRVEPKLIKSAGDLDKTLAYIFAHTPVLQNAVRKLLAVKDAQTKKRK